MASTEVTADRDDLGWQKVIAVRDSVRLPPDPHIMDAIGGNHRLETAVADLVDNAIDAGASRVLIRFVISPQGVQSFYVRGQRPRYSTRAY